MKPFPNLNKTKNRLIDPEKQNKEDENNNKEYVIYFISCFNTSIWNKKIGLRNKKNEVTASIVFETILNFNKDVYQAYIHKIAVKDSNKLVLQVFLNDKDNKILEWDLNSLNLNEENRLYFDNLDINSSYFTKI